MIGFENKYKYIGRFLFIKDAVRARKKAEHDYWGI